MSSYKVVLGLAAPLVAGLALGLGVGPLAAGLSARTVVDTGLEGPDPDEVVVEAVAGRAFVSFGDPGYKPVRKGEKLRRPLSFKTVGLESYVQVRVKGARLVVLHDALMHIGAVGAGLAFQVDRGLVLAHRQKQTVLALVPQYEVDVIGQTFGVWAGPEKITVAVLSDGTEIRHADAEPQKYALNRVVTVRKGRLEPAIMPEVLSTEVITTRRVGGRYRLAARTAINARVYDFGPDGFEAVELTRGGTFAIQTPDESPAAGTVVVLDAAGRWAEFGRPSRPLDDVIADLVKGRPWPTRSVPPPVVKSDRSSREKSSRRRRRRRRTRDDDSASGAPNFDEIDQEERRDAPRKRKRRSKKTAEPPSLEDAEDDELDDAL